MIGILYIVKEQILSRQIKLPNYTSQFGKTIMITGRGRGIGEHAVRKLVKLGARVISGCRKLEFAIQKFQDCPMDGPVSDSLEVIILI